MDIHKPKPWHSFREFLREIGTIVIGVLIALGAEAVVERVHEQRLSAEAREAVRGELNVNITNLSRRTALEPCIARRLHEIAAVLDRAEVGQTFSPPAEIGSPIWGTIYNQRWQTAVAGGRTSLLSSEEQRALGRVYAQLDNLGKAQEAELKAWMHLGALQGLSRLSPEMIYGQRIAVAEARDLDHLITGNLEQATYQARLVGVEGDAHLVLSPGAATYAALPVCHPLAPPGR